MRMDDLFTHFAAMDAGIRNGIVYDKMYEYFTSFLFLSSCSLVSLKSRPRKLILQIVLHKLNDYQYLRYVLTVITTETRQQTNNVKFSILHIPTNIQR
jgi:hypothetical protein